MAPFAFGGACGVRCATLKVAGRSTRMRPRCCDTEICNCRGVEARLAAAAAQLGRRRLRNRFSYDRWRALRLPYTATLRDVTKQRNMFFELSYVLDLEKVQTAIVL